MVKNTLNVGQISEGFVLDHIQAGRSMDIYKYLHLDQLDCCVAIIKNAKSNCMGKKDIMSGKPRQGAEQRDDSELNAAAERESVHGCASFSGMGSGSSACLVGTAEAGTQCALLGYISIAPTGQTYSHIPQPAQADVIRGISPSSSSTARPRRGQRS